MAIALKHQPLSDPDEGEQLIALNERYSETLWVKKSRKVRVSLEINTTIFGTLDRWQSLVCKQAQVIQSDK